MRFQKVIRKSNLDKIELTRNIKQIARDCGFDKAGIAPAKPLSDASLRWWLERSYHGGMTFMENFFLERLDPTRLVDGARSVISVAKNYYTPFQHSDDPAVGLISRYAWGDDYHDVLRPLLQDILLEIQKLVPGTTGRVFIDTAPIMDKLWAVNAGLGWQGKHSNVITPEYGSWVFLGEIVVDRVLMYDEPIPDYCGTCTRCIDACPTRAIVEPYVVNAALCISYLTIELKPECDIPPELAPKLKNLVFGCDICQEVCPWNKKRARETDLTAFYPRSDNVGLKLEQMLTMSPEEFVRRFRKSPVKRPKYSGFLRNVKNAVNNYLHSD